jgi:hypothetical protein
VNLILFFLQLWGIEGGVLFLNNMNNILLTGVYYGIEITNNFLVCESIKYWRKKYKEVEGAREKECIFSGLSFVGNAVFKLRKGKLGIEGGPGIGIHLLKNRVKEKNEYEDWIVIDYYCLTSNTLGLHLESSISIKVAQISLSIGTRRGFIFLHPGEENLFFSRGNLKETAYFLYISF